MSRNLFTPSRLHRAAPHHNGTARGVLVEDLLKLAQKLSDPAFFRYGYTLAGSQSEKKDLTDPYAQVAAVYACIEARARPIGACPLLVYVRSSAGELEAVDTSPFEDLLNRPNPLTSRYQFLHQWETNICRTGNAFVLLDREKPNQIPTAMWVLKTDAMKPVLDERRLPIAWEYRADAGQPKVYQPFQILHDKLPDPDNPVLGRSPLDSADLDIRQEWDVTRWNRSFLSNGCDPGGRYEVEGGAPLAPDQISTLTRSHADKYAGPNRTGEVMVDPGGLKWKANQIPHKDMSFEQQRDFNLRAIKMVLGVPTVALGFEDGITYASAKAEMRLFWTNTLLPRLRMIEDVFWSSLTHDIDGGRYELRFDLQAIDALSDDVSDKSGIIGALFNVGVPVNQINSILSLGIEEYDGWETSYLPGTYFSSGAEGSKAPEADAGKSADPDRGTGEAVTKEKTDLVEFTAEEIAEVKAWDQAVIRPNTKRFHSKMRSYFFEHRSATLERFAQQTGWNGETKAKEPEKPKIPAIGVNIVEIIPPRKDWIDRLLTMTEPLYRETVLQSAQHAASVIGTEAQVVELRGELARAFQETFLSEANQVPIVGVEDTLREALAGSLNEGIEQGETLAELAVRIKDVHKAAQNRSLTIARTEVGRAASWGQNEEYKESGAVEGTRWNAAMDDATRETHKELHRQFAKLGDTFKFPDGSDSGVMYPLDPSGSAAMTINCRCYAAPVLTKE